jgi:histidinol-phosphate phosphatase family protein
MNSLPSKAVFLDRDGVINQKAPEGDYIRTWSEVRLIPGAVDAVAFLNRAGYMVFVVTNQRGVATLKVRVRDLLDIHQRIQNLFSRHGAVISGIYYCPHDLSAKCSCRKPKPGMLQRAAQEHRLDLGASWMIGDSITDVKAGENAGCRSVLLASRPPDGSDSSTPTCAENLELAVRLILNQSCRVESSLVRIQTLDLVRSSSRENA